jgi:hypothetical protein
MDWTRKLWEKEDTVVIPQICWEMIGKFVGNMMENGIMMLITNIPIPQMAICYWENVRNMMET